MNDLVNDGFVSFENRNSGFWPRALPRVVEYAGVKCFVEDCSKSNTWVNRTDIPSEFYAHELLNVTAGIKTNNDPDWEPPSEAEIIESVTDFVSRWGLVFDPARYGSVHQRVKEWSRPFKGAPLMGTRSDRFRLLGVIQTNMVSVGSIAKNGNPAQDLPLSRFPAFPFGRRSTKEMLGDAPMIPVYLGNPRVKQEVGDFLAMRGVLEPAWCEYGGVRVVSVIECVEAIRVVQSVVIAFFDWLGRYLHGEFGGTAAKNAIESFNAYCGNAALFLGEITMEERRWALTVGASSLLPSAFDELIETTLSPDPWKICENRKCGHPFKHKRNSPNMKPLTSKNPPRVKYCCEECRNREAYLRRKDSLENHPDHGIRRA